MRAEIGARALLTAAIASVLLSPQALLATNCTPLVGLPTTSAGAINIAWEGTPTTSEVVGLNNAIMQWNDNCGNSIPDFVTDGSGSFTVTIVPHGGTSPASGICQGRCGCFDGSTQKIHTYAAEAGGATCYDRSQSLMAHELGHYLGLNDATDSSCSGHLMGPELTTSLSVTSAECQAIDSTWETPEENQTVDDRDHPCRHQVT